MHSVGREKGQEGPEPGSCCKDHITLVVAWVAVGAVRMVRSGHILDRNFKVEAGSVDVVCDRASIKRKFKYIYRNCQCFLILLTYYRNNLKNLDTKR